MTSNTFNYTLRARCARWGVIAVSIENCCSFDWARTCAVGRFQSILACHHASIPTGCDSSEAGAVVQRRKVHYEGNALGYASETLGNAVER